MQGLFKQYRFCLAPHLSPTYYHVARQLRALGWRVTRLPWLSCVSEHHFLFDSAAAECLEFKNKLAQLVSEYCPDAMPMTFGINDYNWSFVLDAIAQEYGPDNDVIWILKPATLNNGQHIKLFSALDALKQHFVSSNRLGGEHVLQQYITRPHLLQGPSRPHKYSIRMFVVVTNYAGAYLYPEGYFNVSRYPYEPLLFDDLRCHLTNEHLLENASNVVQIPTRRYDLFHSLYHQIKPMLTCIISGLQKSYPDAFVCKKHRALAIFGFDFMVDASLRVWLLEANHGPCFPIEETHRLQHALYDQFWQAFTHSFIVPIGSKQPVDNIQYSLFEQLVPSLSYATSY